VGLLKVAMWHVEASCSIVRNSQDSAMVALRWLRSVTKTLAVKQKLYIREADPFFVTTVLPHSGMQLALWLLGFRKGGEGGLAASGVDVSLARRFHGILSERILAPASPDRPSKNHIPLAASPQLSHATSPLRCRIEATRINDTNLELVCRWISSKIDQRPGQDEWSVLEVEVFPRLEDVGIGFDGSFGRALKRVLDGEREVEALTRGFDPTTKTAVSKVVQCLQAKA